jgi:flavin-binding protein dodecin
MPMPGVHKKIEIVGTSPLSFSDAVKKAVAEASKSIRHLEWFEVKEERGRIRDGEVAEFQVTILIGFKLEHDSEHK